MKDNRAYVTDEEQVLEFIRLGMDFNTACLASDLSEEKEDELMEDEYFQRQIMCENAKTEVSLLGRHDTASKKAELRGGTSALQWKLEKINPSRYSTKDKGENLFTGKVNINVIRGEDKGKDLEIILQCPECNSLNVIQEDIKVRCRDCKHQVDDVSEDNPFLRYAVNKDMSKK